MDTSNGVYAITKKTDFWFDREVYVIERQAEQWAAQWAAQWAEKGLPRHDVARTEPLEPEQVIGKLCAQTFRDWQLRVRTKMQDAIEESSHALGEQVDLLREKVSRLETLAKDLAHRESRIEYIKANAREAGGRLATTMHRPARSGASACRGYAVTVQRNNKPIAFLNMALALTAVVLGFGYASLDLTDKRGDDPDLIKLRECCASLRAEQIATDCEARAAVAHAHGATSRAQHLLRAHPLRGWQSKVQRLESIVPRFRGENARLRGLDPANIRAFDLPPTLDLPSVDEAISFVEPTEFGRLREELRGLLTDLARFAPAAHAARPNVSAA